MVEKFALENAALPDSMEAMIPDYLEAIPYHPVACTALQYQRDEDGYLIYADDPAKALQIPHARRVAARESAPQESS